MGGFKNPRRIEYEVVNLKDLQRLSSGNYGLAELRAARLVRTKGPVKILGMGVIAQALHLSVHAVSKSAKQGIEKAGGSVTIVE